jgi:flagellar protein FliO/FliZ
LNAASAVEETAPAQTSTAWLFVRMILVLALVIGCIYAVVFFLKRGQRRQMDDDPFLRRTASLTLSPGKSVQVITLGEEAYLIGVTDNAVSLLGKIGDRELVNAMNLHAEENPGAGTPRDFASLLSIFTGQKGRKTRRSVPDSVQNTVSFLQSQRGRIRRVENPEFPTERGE